MITGVDWDLVNSSWWPLIKGALQYTIPLSLIAFAAGLVLALGLALMRMSKLRAVSFIARAYISVIRGTPLLVQLFIIFYGLPDLGITFPPFPAAAIAFTLNVAGYAAEVIRGSILAVPRGQWEAASTVGMGYGLTLRRIVLPQAFRVAVPSLSNTFISLVKDTSLASQILVIELFRVAQQISSPNFKFFQLYVQAALIYWVICLVLSFGQVRLERLLERSVAK